MSDFELISQTGAALDGLYRAHMERDFPDNERKPLPMLEALVERGVNTVWTVERGGQMLAYYVLSHVSGCSSVLLDYFAVVPELRGAGIGSQVLKGIREQLGPERCLLIESELPAAAPNPSERRVRERRIAFYRRCGAELSGLGAQLFGVEYVLMTLGKAPADLEAAYRSLYRAMVPEGFYRKFVRVFALDGQR